MLPLLMLTSEVLSLSIHFLKSNVSHTAELFDKKLLNIYEKALTPIFGCVSV